jgi:MFS family permease
LAVPALGAAALSASNWISAALLLPETYPPDKRGLGAGGGHRTLSWHAVREATRFPGVARIFWVYFLFSSAFSLIEQVLALFIERVWLADKAALGLAAKPAAAMTAEMLMLVGITATVVQGGLIGKLTRRFGEKRLLVAGTFVTAVSLFDVILAGAIGRFSLVLINAIVMATGTGLTNPSLGSLLSRAVDKDRQGSILGLGQSFAALGRVFGPAVSGFLFEYAKDVPFATGAVLMLTCTAVAITLPQAAGGEAAVARAGGLAAH